MILNLDSLFSPFGKVNQIDFEHFIFKGGEPHIKILTDLKSTPTVTICHRIKSFNDFGLLLLAIDAVRRFGVKKINVFIPYFPAARQDRVMVPGEPLSVKVFADLLNNFSLDQISVYDAHSEVTSAVLNNCNAINNHQFISEVIKTLQNPVLISPDGGALKKIYKLSAALGGVEVVECSKSRDVKTGQLSGFKVYYEDLKNRDCLIVDDICDGGGTFMGLAGELKKKNAGRLFLAVSHGIFSKGFDSLSQYFDKIYCTDSFQTINHDSVIQYKLETLLNK